VGPSAKIGELRQQTLGEFNDAIAPWKKAIANLIS
jgi:hypothetical protein